MPTVATLNFDPNEPAIANGAIVPLTQDLQFNITIYLGSGVGTTANVVFDASGYFK